MNLLVFEYSILLLISQLVDYFECALINKDSNEEKCNNFINLLDDLEEVNEYDENNNSNNGININININNISKILVILI